MKQRAGFLNSLIKLTNLQKTDTEKKKTQNTKIRNKWDITTYTPDIKRIIKGYYEQLQRHRFDDLDKMDQFLKQSKLLQLTQYEIDHLNRPIFIKEIEFIILKLLKKGNSSSDGFMGEFYQIFKEELTQILHNLPEKEKKEHVPIHFIELVLP